MNNATTIVLGLVALAAIGAGLYVYSQRQVTLTPGQRIGSGIGNLVGGIIDAAGVT